MNDFTKEELDKIKSCVYFDGWRPEHDNTNQILLDKIQSMIENHHECDMEYIGYVEATQCAHCGKRE